MPTVTVNTVATDAAAHASKALSRLLGQEVRVLFQAAGVKKPQELHPMLRADEIVTVILMRITGEAEGVACLVLPGATADSISGFLTSGRAERGQAAEMAKSALMEVGNIVTGAYLTVLSNRVGAKLIEHVPQVACDMFGSILSQVVGQCSTMSTGMLVAEVHFSFLPSHWCGYLLVALDCEHSPRLSALLQNAQTPAALEKTSAGRRG
jgi:chemotaxis protein CheC